MYGDVRFKLGGSYYTARYSNAAWDDVKSCLDVATETECVRMATSDTPFLVLLGAGLSHYHLSIDIQAVAGLAMIDALGAGETLLRDACFEAIELSLPAPVPKKPEAIAKKHPPKPDAHALRREAFKTGMGPVEFSAITPREAVMFIEAFTWRQEQAKRIAISTAWHTEAFARTKRLKPLRDILARIDRDSVADPKAAAAVRAENARDWFARRKAAKAAAAGERTH